jgi:hypothetical protein
MLLESFLIHQEHLGHEVLVSVRMGLRIVNARECALRIWIVQLLLGDAQIQLRDMILMVLRYPRKTVCHGFLLCLFHIPVGKTWCKEQLLLLHLIRPFLLAPPRYIGHVASLLK